MTNRAAVFELKGIDKSFHGVRALRGVDLSLQQGSIHAVIGENGAGKSTLINIATGVLQPDQGQILVAGRPTKISQPRAASRLGIHVVHQEAELFSQLSLAENMLLSDGLVSRRVLSPLIDWPATYARAGQELAAMKVRGDVGQAASGSRQILPPRFPAGPWCCFWMSRPLLSLRARRAS